MMQGAGSEQHVTELKQRLWFVFLALLVYRVAAHIPVPGLDPERLAQLFSGNQNGILGLFNLFSGGALSRLTVVSLGVMPYITTSIIMQLLTVISPALEQLKKEGEVGRRKIARYTRMGTLVLATFQGFGMARYLASAGIALDPTLGFYFVTTLTLVTGTLFLMWLGEQITERGVGNGVSLIIFAGIVSGMPSAISSTVEQVRQGVMQPIALVFLILVLLGITAFVVFMERAQRRIAVSYARVQPGRQMTGMQQSHLPLKINMAGPIPPIFASSIVLFPATLSQWLGQNSDLGWLTEIGMALSPGQPLYVLLFGLAIVFFCFLYTALIFNPRETADNLKRSGAFLPGIRPGEQTALYIDKVMTRLTVVGAAYITGVSLLPEFLILGWQVPFYFGGTSLLIAVVVVMDFIAQVQSHLMARQYESLMKKANLKARRG